MERMQRYLCQRNAVASAPSEKIPLVFVCGDSDYFWNSCLQYYFLSGLTVHRHRLTDHFSKDYPARVFGPFRVYIICLYLISSYGTMHCNQRQFYNVFSCPTSCSLFTLMHWHSGHDTDFVFSLKGEKLQN